MVHRDLRHLVTKTCSISKRVIYILIRLNDRYTLQVIQAYAPTNAAEHEEAEQFYKDLTAAKRAEKAKL